MALELANVKGGKLAKFRVLIAGISLAALSMTGCSTTATKTQATDAASPSSSDSSSAQSIAGATDVGEYSPISSAAAKARFSEIMRASCDKAAAEGAVVTQLGNPADFAINLPLAEAKFAPVKNGVKTMTNAAYPGWGWPLAAVSTNLQMWRTGDGFFWTDTDFLLNCNDSRFIGDSKNPVNEFDPLDNEVKVLTSGLLQIRMRNVVQNPDGSFTVFEGYQSPDLSAKIYKATDGLFTEVSGSTVRFGISNEDRKTYAKWLKFYQFVMNDQTGENPNGYTPIPSATPTPGITRPDYPIWNVTANSTQAADKVNLLDVMKASRDKADSVGMQQDSVSYFNLDYPNPTVYNKANWKGEPIGNFVFFFNAHFIETLKNANTLVAKTGEHEFYVYIPGRAPFAIYTTSDNLVFYIYPFGKDGARASYVFQYGLAEGNKQSKVGMISGAYCDAILDRHC